MSIPLDELSAPADADNFRMTVNYGRMYIDPLPGCDIAPATEDQWPSFTGVKGAAGKDWSFLVAPRLANLPDAELHRLADLDPMRRLDAIKSHEKHGKQIAFGRGTIVHAWNQDLGHGLEPREITDRWLAANRYPAEARTEAERYRAAIVDFWQTYQPELVADEYVTIHRTLNDVGYGATPDAIIRIEGDVLAVDYKTRSDGSSHAAYAEEAAQIAAGVFAEYMIVGHGDGARRQLLPKVDGGLVVSIKSDGARLYPIDVDKAWDHFVHLHEWYCHKQTEKASISRVLPRRSAPKIEREECPSPQATETSAPPALDRDALVARYKALAPELQERFNDKGIAKGDLVAVTAALDELEQGEETWTTESPVASPSAEPTTGSLPLGDTTKAQPSPPSEMPATNTSPVSTGSPTTLSLARQRMATETKPPPPERDDEGGPADEADIAIARARYQLGITPEQRLWVDSIISGAKAAGRTIHIKDRSTQRRADLYCAITQYAGCKHWDADNDDGFRAALYAVIGSETCFFPTSTLGDLVSQLSAVDARELRGVVDAIDQGLLAPATCGEGDNKTPAWAPARVA